MNTLAQTKYGEEKLRTMQMCNIECVRSIIDKLIESGYDTREPVSTTKQKILYDRDVAFELLLRFHQAQEMSSALQFAIEGKISQVLDCVHYIQSTLIPCLSLVPFKEFKSGLDLVSDFDGLFYGLREACNLMQAEHVEKSKLFDEMDDHNLALDSDEEEILFKEIDQLSAAQERMEAFNGDVAKFMAFSFQKAFRSIENLENSFRLLCKAFEEVGYGAGNEKEPVILGPENLKEAARRLLFPEISKIELENIIDDGLNFIKKYVLKSDSYVSEAQTNDSEAEGGIKLSVLIAGSDLLRKLFLNLVTDQIYCALAKTHLADLVSPKQLKTLSIGAVERKSDIIGTTVYSSKSCKHEWFVLTSGKLRIKTHHENVQPFEFEQEDFEIWEGEIFGGFDFFEFDEEQNHFELVVVKPCTFIELKGQVLEALMDEDPHVASDCYDMLGRLPAIIFNIFLYFKYLILAICFRGRVGFFVCAEKWGVWNRSNIQIFFRNHGIFRSRGNE